MIINIDPLQVQIVVDIIPHTVLMFNMMVKCLQ